MIPMNDEANASVGCVSGTLSHSERFCPDRASTVIVGLATMIGPMIACMRT